MENKFEFDVNNFIRDIDILCLDGVDFLDAVLTWCDRNNFEIETIAPIIKKDAMLKARMTVIAEDMNFFKKPKVVVEPED